MAYRYLTATRLFDGQTFSKAHVLVVAEDGSVNGLVPETEATGPVERFEGILMPGMINCHCHLELSHMKGVIPPGTGLVPFLISVVTKRDGDNDTEKDGKIRAAEQEIFQNGIVAVADICNTADTVAVKEASNITWYNLVEVLNLRDANLPTALNQYGAVLEQYTAAGLEAVLTPHAPYTISEATFNELNARSAGKLISVHNCETRAEEELFVSGTGAFLNLFQLFGFTATPFAISGRSSIQTWLPYFTSGQTILLVHNSFMSEADIVFANEHAAAHGLKLVYCLCPNANLYIENVLPPVELFLKHNCTIVLGTDSYSSNWQLSIASEIKTLKERLPQLSLEQLLQWATSNASVLKPFKQLGRFEKDTRPGVVLLNETDFSVQRIM